MHELILLVRSYRLNSDEQINRKTYEMASDILDTDNDGLASKTDLKCAPYDAFTCSTNIVMGIYLGRQFGVEQFRYRWRLLHQ